MEREQGKKTVKKTSVKKKHCTKETAHAIQSRERCSEQVGIHMLPDCRRLALKLLLVVNSFLY